MNWYAFAGFTILMWFAGPGDPQNVPDGMFAITICLIVGLLLGRAFA